MTLYILNPDGTPIHRRAKDIKLTFSEYPNCITMHIKKQVFFQHFVEEFERLTGEKWYKGKPFTINIKPNQQMVIIGGHDNKKITPLPAHKHVQAAIEDYQKIFLVEGYFDEEEEYGHWALDQFKEDRDWMDLVLDLATFDTKEEEIPTDELYKTFLYLLKFNNISFAGPKRHFRYIVWSHLFQALIGNKKQEKHVPLTTRHTESLMVSNWADAKLSAYYAAK